MQDIGGSIAVSAQASAEFEHKFVDPWLAQTRIYLADLPRQVRGEVDLMRSDILSSAGVASMQGDLHMSAAAAARIASTAEGITPLVLNERRIVLDEVSRQRALG